MEKTGVKPERQKLLNLKMKGKCIIAFLLSNEIREKSQNLYVISAVVEDQHIVEFTTSTSAPKILYNKIFAFWLYLIYS